MPKTLGTVARQCRSELAALDEVEQGLEGSRRWVELPESPDRHIGCLPRSAPAANRPRAGQRPPYRR